MKNNHLIPAVLVFLIVCQSAITAQNNEPALNQLELMKQFTGKWQSEPGKDTIEIWDNHLYGNSIIMEVSLVVKGKRSDYYINNTGFDIRDGKLKGYILQTDASYSTWIGLFTTPVKLSVMVVDELNRDKLFGMIDFDFINASTVIKTDFTKEGLAMGRHKFTKVKL